MGDEQLGNVHPEILKATVDALERYGFLILFMNPHLPMIDVAERLLSIRPSDNLTRVFLELSGTGAAEGAVKHAIEASGRPLILSFMGQYHGSASERPRLDSRLEDATELEAFSRRHPLAVPDDVSETEGHDGRSVR